MKADSKDRIAAAVAELREATRKDLASTWSDRLRAAWEEEIDRVLKARAAVMLPRLREAVQFDVGWRLAAELEAAAPGIAKRARRESAQRFNRAVRRLMAAGAEWPAVLMDVIQEFAAKTALFAVRGNMLAACREAIEVPLDRAPAFRNAIESRDTVVALRTAGELSEEVAALGHAPRCYLFPVVAGDWVAAVVYAEDDQLDVDALEAISAAAGAAVRLAVPQPAEPRASVEHADREDASSHETDQQAASTEIMRAQNFARIRVAEMMLYRHDAVRSGRESRDLYSELRKEIDSAREAYADRFASTEDFLHAELVQTLARGDAGALGAGYPGPLP